MKKHRTRLLVGTLISLLLLAWVIWRTDWAQVAVRLQEANPLMLLAAFLAVVGGVLLRAWRWGMMLEPEEEGSVFIALFDAINLGYLANNILPARLGDLLRAYLAAEWTRASLSFSLSTTVVERVLDTLYVVIMLFGVLPFLPVPPMAAQAGLLVGVLFFLGGIMLVVAAWQRELSERLIRACLRPLPFDEELWGNRLVALLDGFSIVRQPLRFARVLWSTTLIWLVAIASYWFTFQAFGLDFLNFVSGAFTISFAALGMAVPSGPAAAGTFDAAVTSALEILSVSGDLAGGVAVVIHALNFLAVIMLGIWSMVRRGLSLTSLTSQMEQAEEMPA